MAVALACTSMFATPASAHGAAQPIPDAAYYRAALISVVPATPGVTVQVDPKAEWLQVASTTDKTVDVLGYLKEPYLRITTSGVDENQLSQSTLLNKSLFGDPIPSAQGTTNAAPAWKRTTTRRTVRWHDHRIHWMGAERPPAVAADPTHPHLVGTWTVHLLIGGAPALARGELRWLGKPAAPASMFTTPRIVAANIAMLAIIAAVTLWTRRRRTRPGAAPAIHETVSP